MVRKIEIVVGKKYLPNTLKYQVAFFHIKEKNERHCNRSFISACNRLFQLVRDLLAQRGPSAESVTDPVEAFSQRVTSSPPFFVTVLSVYASM